MTTSMGLMLFLPHRYFHDGWFLAGIPLAILAAAIIPYFIPSIIAFLRRHQSAVPLLLVNIFFGWTLIGWIICLVWALTGSGSPATAVAPPPPPEAKTAEPAPALDRKYCIQCGTQIEPTGAFCHRCGTKTGS